MSLTVAQIVAAWGAYYINQGQNMTNIKRQLRDKSTTDELFSTRVTDNTLYREMEAVTDRLLQPFQKGWTPIGNTTFKPVDIQAYEVKMDREVYPDTIEATYLGFLADNNLNRKDWPIVRWLVEEDSLPQIKEDYELNEVFKGVYVSPTTGTAGPASTAMNGIKNIRNTHIAGGRITPITMGAIPATDAGVCDYFEDFVAQVNDKYWGLAMEISCSPQLDRRFKIGYKAKYGLNVDYQRNDNGDVDFSMMKVVGKPSHRGSDIIWTTPKANAIRLVKKSANMDRIELEQEDRKVKMWTDFWVGLGFSIPEIVFTNDLETI